MPCLYTQTPNWVQKGDLEVLRCRDKIHGLWGQFIFWLSHLLVGDFGQSSEPVNLSVHIYKMGWQVVVTSERHSMRRAVHRLGPQGALLEDWDVLLGGW